jgi:hypothetical protein
MYWKNVIGYEVHNILENISQREFFEVNMVWVDHSACDQAPSSFDFKSTNMECHIQSRFTLGHL